MASQLGSLGLDNSAQRAPAARHLRPPAVSSQDTCEVGVGKGQSSLNIRKLLEAKLAEQMIVTSIAVAPGVAATSASVTAVPVGSPPNRKKRKHAVQGFKCGGCQKFMSYEDTITPCTACKDAVACDECVNDDKEFVCSACVEV